MRGARDEIAAAIPFRAFLLVRFEYAGPEEQEIPGAHDDAVIQRPAQFRRRRTVGNRRQRREIGADRQQIVAGQFREVGIGKSRVIARTVAPHAVTQRAGEFVVAPCTEAGFAIRRQVGRINRPERGIYALAAGERLDGSALWQLAQSAASTSALPRPMVSAE